MRGLTFGIGTTALVLTVAWSFAMPHWRERTQGAALYEGRQALTARLSGHAEALPAAAVRCTNCHEGAQAIGPLLNARDLAQEAPRRGGPPSRYDERSLCQLLRNGIDPAMVIVAKGMPRYDVTDADCAALWAHLSSR